MSGQAGGQEVLRDPILRKAFFGAFLNFHVWALTAVLGALGTWVWATDDAVKALEADVEHRSAIIESIPKIERDVEVLREKALQQEKTSGEINRKLDRIEDIILDRHGNGNGR